MRALLVTCTLGGPGTYRTSSQAGHAAAARRIAHARALMAVNGAVNGAAVDSPANGMAQHNSLNGKSGVAINGKAKNGSADHNALTADRLYLLMLEARPMSGTWFSIWDTATRLTLALLCFYRFLIFQPLSMCIFAFRWNSLW